MSARDDQPVTVPPPPGEDDAYSAATKVGAMPADLMEKLRAEGLLPEEAEKERTPVNRPSTSLDRRPTSRPPAIDGGPVPQLYSTTPPAMDEHNSESKILTARPPAQVITSPPEPGALETSAAFVMPPSAGIPKIGEAAEVAAAAKKTAGAPSTTTLYLVAAVVVVLLIVALMRLRG